MPFRQLDNPAGAFGYDVTLQDRGSATVMGQYRNMSSSFPIRRGQAVILSTASTDGTGVVASTIIGSPLFVGVAVSSGSTDQSTALTTNALGTAWVDVVISGVVENALLSTGVTAGEAVWLTNTTAANVAEGGGVLGAAATSVAAAAFVGVAGIALSSGSTVSTSGSTQFPRGRVLIRPSINALSSV